MIEIGNGLLNGELIAPDDTGQPQFYDLLRRMRKPVYVAFDLLWLNGCGPCSLPFSERRRGLKGILPAESPVISLALSAAEQPARRRLTLSCHFGAVWLSRHGARWQRYQTGMIVLSLSVCESYERRSDQDNHRGSACYH